MQAPPETVEVDLDRPLPTEIVGSGHGLFTRYRIWPVFSARWARGRQARFGPIALALLLVLMAPLALPPRADLPLGGLVHLLVQLGVPILAGPWIGVWVRRRRWAPAREERALVASQLLLVLAVLLFHGIAAEPLKQWLAEATGQVDAQGKRKRMVMMLGISVSTPDDAAQVPPPGRLPPETLILNGASSALATFALAGGFGLWARRRELAGLARLAQERALQNAQAARREAEMRLSVLAAQVEPHFLFNTLAGVRAAIEVDPSRASDMVDRLVEYLRAAIPRLRGEGRAQATLGDQLDIVRAYLGLMAARMPRLRFRIDAPEALLATPFPPLMLISLAENAIKHGAEPKIGSVEIAVRARDTGDRRLEVTVADDGAGFGGHASGSGLGLTNIRERLRQMYGDHASLVLKARPDGGVAAILTLPME